jgi:hypothetical protein
MRRSRVRFPEAALRPFGLASVLFGRMLEGQRGLVGPVRMLFSPRLVRIQFREGLIESVRNSVEIVGEQACVDVEGHGRGGMAKHLLYSLDVGARCHGETGSGVPQLVRCEPGQPRPLGGSKNRGRKFVLRSTPPSGAVNTRSSGAFSARWPASSSARKRGIGTDRRWWVLVVPTTTRPWTSVIASTTSILRRRRSRRRAVRATTPPHRRPA